MLDFEDPDNNDCSPLTNSPVVENKHERRPDIVLFVNGLPLGVIELKNPTDEDATIWTGLAADPDLQGGNILAVCHECGLDGFGRNGGTNRHVDRRQGVVQALADDYG